MKLKLNKDGSAVVRNGMPVYILDNGTEREIDGAAAFKLALGKHFEASPVMAGLKLPADIIAASFGSHFDIQGGKFVALDQHGIKEYSSTRHGEVATFDEALGQIIGRYKNKDMILKEPGAPATTSAPGQQHGKGSIITRAQFDALPPASRGKFMAEGGRIGEVASAGTPAPAPTPGAGTITRPQFDVLGPRERALHFQNGGKVVD